MTDSQTGAGAELRGPVTGSSGEPSPTVDALPEIGAAWRGAFRVVRELTATPGAKVWLGTASDGRDVEIRAWKPAEPRLRAAAWEKLLGIDSPHLIRARDAAVCGDWRIETTDRPTGQSLAEWRRAQTSHDPVTVKTMVAQVTEALEALHAFDLVHLSVSPDSVFVATGTEGPVFSIGSAVTVVMLDPKAVIPVAFDPLIAPPEGVDLDFQIADAGLKRWDWWALGRLVQYAILGHPVAVASVDDPDVRQRALDLLTEATPSPRAGAVENMPALETPLIQVMRGLLSSAPICRWTGADVDRWVRGMPVKDSYTIKRKETHLKWRRRPYTVATLAAELQSAENWNEAKQHLFDCNTPGTLASFLRFSDEYGEEKEKLEYASDLGNVLPLSLAPEAVRRETSAIVALTTLSRGRMLWRGRPFDGAAIDAILAEWGEVDGVSVLRALTIRATSMMIERTDQAAGRALNDLGQTVASAEGILKRHGWLAATDTAMPARVFQMALQPPAVLKGYREQLQATFAGSDHPAMEKLFKSQTLNRADYVVLGLATLDPAKYKFFTHTEAARRRADALRTRATELTQALAWERFGRALSAGTLVYWGWGWFVLGWLLVGAAVLVLWPGPRFAVLVIAPALVALLVRMATAKRLQRALRSSLPDATWKWTDGPARCRTELRLAGGSKGADFLQNELAALRQEFSALPALTPPPAPLPELNEFRAVRRLALGSWVLLFGFLGVAGWRISTTPVDRAAVAAAWSPKPAQKTAEAGTVAAKPAEELLAAEEKEDIKVTWPYKLTQPEKLDVVSTRAATEAEREQVRARGKAIVAPYRPDTITYIILPVEDRRTMGVMIFDGKRGELLNEQVYALTYHPIGRSIVDLAGRKGVYLEN